MDQSKSNCSEVRENGVWSLVEHLEIAPKRAYSVSLLRPWSRLEASKRSNIGRRLSVLTKNAMRKRWLPEKDF
jgi:hypothetical protein